MTVWEGAPVFTHLLALSDDRAVFEHARFDAPRREHGYCVDDVARALIVLVREPSLPDDLERLSATCLRFVESAVAVDGRAHNRMSVHGRFTDEAALGDWWGRALWALGFASARASTDAARSCALTGFRRAAAARSVDLRALSFAALGAAQVLLRHPADAQAEALLRDAVAAIPVSSDPAWPWPEPKLRYANAALAEALLAAGAGLNDLDLIDRGLQMLRFLVDVETLDGHLSVTGVDGRGPSDRAAQFDQQPIEVAAIADACAHAYTITGDEEWMHRVAQAWAWFTGHNDTGAVMFDPVTGAGFDGLTPSGRNENRGAESTLAALSTYQQARRLRVVHTLAA